MARRIRFGLGVEDLIFLLVLGLGLGAGRHAFLNDPGTFWHLRLGRDILHSRDVPRTDALTFTRHGAEWVDQAWLFDVGLRWLWTITGWGGAVGVTALLLAWTYALLARGLIRAIPSSCSVFAAVLLAVGIGATHFLTRPHLFTFMGVAWTTLACRDFARGKSSGLAWTPLVVALWANLHGGFLAGPIIVLGSAIGFAISPIDREERRRGLGTYARTLALCTFAPLANPSGFGLYRHVWSVLRGSRVTDLIQEYQPPAFGSSETWALELAIVALIALPIVCRAAMSRHDLVQTLVWLHLALGSIRQAPLFGMVACAGLATLFSSITAPKPSEPAAEPAGSMFWSIAASLAVGLAILLGLPLGGHDPDRWPIAGLKALDRESPSLRLFHEQDWGGMIESECSPQRRAFIDDRFELFGRQRILDYVGMLEGGPSWDEANAQNPFDLAWLKPTRPLARKLQADANWSVVHSDTVSILLKRTYRGASVDALSIRMIIPILLSLFLPAVAEREFSPRALRASASTPADWLELMRRSKRPSSTRRSRARSCWSRDTARLRIARRSAPVRSSPRSSR